MMGILKQDHYVTEAEFERINNETSELLEYVDGQIYALASPSIAHQRVSMRLSNIFFNHFDGGPCESFAAPIDVRLVKEGLGNHLVIPDLVIICDKEGLNDKRYEGVPNLIVEILSPSNQHHDLIIKMNLYAKYGVKEYWIVNPMNQSVSIYTLDNEQHYIQDIVKTSGIVESKLYPGLVVDLNKLF